MAFIEERKYLYVYKGETRQGHRHKIHLQTDRAVLDIPKIKAIIKAENSPGPAKRRAINKLKILEKCDYKCVKCGETEALTIFVPKGLGNKYDPEFYANGDVYCVWCRGKM